VGLVCLQSRFLKPGQAETILHAIPHVILPVLNLGKTSVTLSAKEVTPDGTVIAIIYFGMSSIVSMLTMGFTLFASGRLTRQSKQLGLFDSFSRALMVNLLIALYHLVRGFWYMDSSVVYTLSAFVPVVGLYLWIVTPVLSA